MLLSVRRCFGVLRGPAYLLEHDNNTPSDCPLLSTYQTAALRGICNFRDVDWDLRGAYAYAATIEDTPNDKHRDVL